MPHRTDSHILPSSALYTPLYTIFQGNGFDVWAKTPYYKRMHTLQGMRDPYLHLGLKALLSKPGDGSCTSAGSTQMLSDICCLADKELTHIRCPVSPYPKYRHESRLPPSWVTSQPAAHLIFHSHIRQSGGPSSAERPWLSCSSHGKKCRWVKSLRMTVSLVIISKN